MDVFRLYVWRKSVEHRTHVGEMEKFMEYTRCTVVYWWPEMGWGMSVNSENTNECRFYGYAHCVYDLLQFRIYTRNTSAVVYLFLGKYGIECHFERTNERGAHTARCALFCSICFEIDEHNVKQQIAHANGSNTIVIHDLRRKLITKISALFLAADFQPSVVCRACLDDAQTSHELDAFCLIKINDDTKSLAALQIRDLPLSICLCVCSGCKCAAIFDLFSSCCRFFACLSLVLAFFFIKIMLFSSLS